MQKKLHAALLFTVLRKLIARSEIDIVPLLTGQVDFGRLDAIPEAAEVHRADDGLELGRMAQQPGHGDGGVGNVVTRGNLVNGGIELGELVIAEEHALEEAVLEGRPGLNGDVVQAAVVQHGTIAIHRGVKGRVDVDAGGDHGAVGDGKLELVGTDGHRHVLLQQLHLHGILVGNAEVQHLAAGLESGEGLCHLHGIHQRVGTVQQQRVYNPETRKNEFNDYDNSFLILLFGVIGFIDDFAKVAKKQNEGLKPMQKIVLQVVAAVLWLAAMYWLGDRDTHIDLGFVRFNISWFYYPLMVLVILYLTNAVNLTDGVDGLCGTVTLVAMLIFTLICSKLQMGCYTLFTMALAGGCLGFLVWNLHPAKCFMGDTGSMYLGASVAAIGLASHQHLSMILVALVYILEALSVMIQVTYFKYTKKKYGEGRRIFKMTPIHHHFEMSGFSEYKIVITFSLFGAVTGLCGLLLVLL